MRYVGQILSLVLLVAVAVAVFHLFQRRLSDAAFTFTVNPEVLEQLERSLQDQRELARLRPEDREMYRRRFEDLERTVQHLKIISHSRDNLVRRYETIVLVGFAIIVLAVTAVWVVRQLRLQPRLGRLQGALTELAEGRTDLDVGVRGEDVVGRIATMIERTSRVMARDRRRLATLNNLSAWQEAARRHAHEMRTPLTGARLELEKIRDLAQSEHGGNADAVVSAAVGALEELDRLGSFTHRFTTFARLPRPKLVPVDLGSVLQRFIDSYADAWPNLRITLDAKTGERVSIDEDMFRQVLANLCDNSSRARGAERGTVALSVAQGRDGVLLDVTDNGPGVDPSVRDRLFEPYTTTRTIGDGMGLGLAISKKIMLEHGGDLELANTSPEGTTLRLILPVRAAKDDEP